MTPLIENVMKHSPFITIAMLAVVMTACTQDDMHDGTNLITFEATPPVHRHPTAAVTRRHHSPSMPSKTAHRSSTSTAMW